MSTEPKPQYVTRKTGVELANKVGLPLKEFTVNKDAMNGRGPEVFGRLGKTELHTIEAFMKYAIERVAIRKPEAADAE